MTVEPVTRVEGTALPLDRADVDTDQIIQAQYLKRVERAGFGPYLFDEWRKDPAFVFNDARFAGSSILLAGPNFGCGSSREHAPWAIEDYGFRAVIAPSFGDIFRNNSFQNGLLPILLPIETVEGLIAAVEQTPAARISVDLEGQKVTGPDGMEHAFEIDPFRKQCLLAGTDDMGFTLGLKGEIETFEKTYERTLPWL